MYFRDNEKLQLSAHFVETLEALPSNYSVDPVAYGAFVRTFGTHYWFMARFGGFMYENTAIDSGYQEVTNSRELEANLKLSFKKFISVDASTEMSQTTEESRKEFQKNSETSFYYYGGEGKL